MSKEWKAHIYKNNRGIFAVFPELCKGCGLCIAKCPTQVIEWSKSLAFNGFPTVEPRIKGCIACGTCQTVCPDAAIAIYRHDGHHPVGEPKTTPGPGRP